MLWEKEFAALVAYVKAKGNARVPYEYRNANGYRLGLWVTTQRSKRHSMSADRHRRLAKVKGWMWKAR